MGVVKKLRSKSDIVYVISRPWDNTPVAGLLPQLELWKHHSHPSSLIAFARLPASGISVARQKNANLRCIRDFILFHQKRHPKSMSVPEVQSCPSVYC